MMEYNRLTTSENKHRPYALECFKCFNKECNRCDIDYDVWERLAELEDKIEQGTLIELPRMFKAIDGTGWVVEFIDESGCVCRNHFFHEEKAIKRLKELKNG